MKFKKIILLLISLVVVFTLFFQGTSTHQPTQKFSEGIILKADTSLVPLTSKLPTVMVKGSDTSFPIQMAELKINSRIVGTIAITTMDMLFYNDSSIVLSGDLYFPLNEGQTVSRFALDVNGKLREGVVVEKAKGREVFENMVRRGIDPGLVELTKGNNFKTRIYPIPAKGYKRVVVSYEQELINNNQHIYYQLPLYFNETVNKFSLNIEVEGGDLPTVEKGKLSNFAFEEWKEVYKASFEHNNFTAQQELVIQIPQTNKAIQSMVEKAANGDHYFYTHINPTLYKKEKQAPSSLCIVWDVSSSASTRDVEKEIKVLEGYLSQLPNAKLRLVTFANQIQLNKPFDNWQQLKTELVNLTYDGATQLGTIPFASYTESEFILVSDAIHTFGKSTINLPLKPLYVLNSSAGADYAIQKYLTNATGGQTINLTTSTIKQAINQLQQVQYQFISSEISSGELIEIYPQIAQKAEGSFSIAGILKSAKAEVKLNFGFGTTIMWSKTVPINPTKAYQGKGIASRIWAEKKLEDLNVHYEKNKEEITALGKAYSIVTKNTSLIVLDNVADYADNEITPPTELLAEYNSLLNDKNRLARTQKADKAEMVRANWQLRVDWWNKTFDVKEKKQKKYDWSDTSETPRDEDTSSASIVAVNDEEEVMVDLDVDMSSTEGEELMDAGNSQIIRTPRFRHGGNARFNKNEEQEKTFLGKETRKKITIKEWQPDNPAFKKLSSQEPQSCYATYLELREKNSEQPTFYADAARVLHKKGRNKEAIRVLSNLAELELENHELLKVLANTLLEWHEIDLAVMVYADILTQREEEPQSYRDLGLALYAQGNPQAAIEMLYTVITKDWNNRFPQIENIVLGEINSIIANSKTTLNTHFMDSTLVDHLPTDVRIIIDWDADNVDIDLWVTDPRGEKCFYSHPDTKIGGHISNDFTRGYGPEEFLLKKAIKGNYKVEVNYYGTSQQRVAGPPTIKAKLITNYGKANQKEESIILRLQGSKSIVYVGELVVL